MNYYIIRLNSIDYLFVEVLCCSLSQKAIEQNFKVLKKSFNEIGIDNVVILPVWDQTKTINEIRAEKGLPNMPITTELEEAVKAIHRIKNVQ